MIEIQTFTCRYDDIEDRIRLIVNYKEYEKRVDYMITRSFIIKLLPIMEEFLVKHYNEHIPGTNEKVGEQEQKSQQQSEENLGRKIHIKTDNTTLELMKKEPVLLTKIDLSFIDDNKGTLLVLTGKKEETSRALLSQEILTSFLKALNGAIPKTSWGILGLI